LDSKIAKWVKGSYISHASSGLKKVYNFVLVLGCCTWTSKRA